MLKLNSKKVENLDIKPLTIILFCFFMSISRLTYAQLAAPAQYILYQEWPEDIETPYGKHLRPLIAENLLNKPNGTKIYSIQPNEEVCLLSSVLYTYPAKFPVKIIALPLEIKAELEQLNPGKKLPQENEYIYLMSSIGQDRYVAWYEDQVICVFGKGIKGVQSDMVNNPTSYWGIYTGNKPVSFDLWLYLQGDSSCGWAKYTAKDWQKNNDSVFY